MDYSARRSAQIVASVLFAVVVTQITYFALYSGGADINRMIIWTVESVAFLAVSVFALIPLVRGENYLVAWAAIALGGVFNVIQVGMGLAMFGPVEAAGEAMAPAYDAILAGAFFLYFAGKFLFGFAAILLGLGLQRHGGSAKVIGILALLAGSAAMLTNLGAMAVGMDMVLPAGAAGTTATLLLGLAIIFVNRTQDA